MQTATFEVKTHEEYGFTGLWFVGRHWAEPAEGIGAAHDVLEHGFNDDGEPEGEYRALGAMMWVRGEGYFLARGRSRDMAELLGYEIVQQIRYAQAGGRFHLRLNAAKPCRALNADDAEVEQWFQGAIQHAQKEAASEFEHEEADSLERTYVADNAKIILHHLREGYRAAKRRYRGVPRFALVHAFQELEAELDRALKHHEYEGQRITAKLVRQGAGYEVRVQAVYDEEAY